MPLDTLFVTVLWAAFAGWLALRWKGLGVNIRRSLALFAGAWLLVLVRQWGNTDLLPGGEPLGFVLTVGATLLLLGAGAVLVRPTLDYVLSRG